MKDDDDDDALFEMLTLYVRCLKTVAATGVDVENLPLPEEVLDDFDVVIASSSESKIMARSISAGNVRMLKMAYRSGERVYIDDVMRRPDQYLTNPVTTQYILDRVPDAEFSDANMQRLLLERGTHAFVVPYLLDRFRHWTVPLPVALRLIVNRNLEGPVARHILDERMSPADRHEVLRRIQSPARIVKLDLDPTETLEYLRAMRNHGACPWIDYPPRFPFSDVYSEAELYNRLEANLKHRHWSLAVTLRVLHHLYDRRALGRLLYDRAWDVWLTETEIVEVFVDREPPTRLARFVRTWLARLPATRGLETRLIVMAERGLIHVGRRARDLLAVAGASYRWTVTMIDLGAVPTADQVVSYAERVGCPHLLDLALTAYETRHRPRLMPRAARTRLVAAGLQSSRLRNVLLAHPALGFTDADFPNHNHHSIVLVD